MEIILIVFFVILFIANIFVIRNLLKKVEFYEDMSVELTAVNKQYELWFKDFSEKIKEANKKIKEIDVKGSFESDDEVGFFFAELKLLSNDLEIIVSESKNNPIQEGEPEDGQN